MDVLEGILKKQKDNKVVFQQSQYPEDSLSVPKKNLLVTKTNSSRQDSPGGSSSKAPQLNKAPSGTLQTEENLESLLPYTKHCKIPSNQYIL